METTSYLNTVAQPHFAADFDYFRIPAEKWPLFLARLHQLGLTTLNLTIPWQFHQPTPAHIDFNSSPRKNLPALLQLCGTLNFRCMLQPGPVTPHHGLLNRGLPHWLTAPPDLFDAAFRQAATGWLDALSGALVSHQWPAGPVIALALTFADDSPGAALSPHVSEVRWPIWLRKKYHSLDALNAAHHADYATFNAAPLPPAPSINSPLAADARAFLSEIRTDSAGEFVSRLRDAGWSVPLYPFAAGDAPLLRPTPAIAPQFPGSGIVILQQPIQVEPDPPDIAATPGWAADAPLRADGSPRRAFRHLRQRLQPPASGIELLDAMQDIDLKIDLPKGSRPQVFTLYFNGEIAENTDVAASRGKLKGPFVLEDVTGHVDRLLCLADPAAPLSPSVAACLQPLLALQQATLLACVRQAEALSAQLTGGQASPPAPGTPARRAAQGPTPATITEARRGLHQAEAALKKAMSALGGLETGFDSILQRGQPAETPQPDAPPVAVTAAAFEGPARDSLLRAAEVCAAIAAPLKTAASTLTAVDASSLTLAEYRQNFAAATHAAHNAQHALLPLLELMRLELASEQLPLVAWRVHQQVLHLSESLRWGVLRR